MAQPVPEVVVTGVGVISPIGVGRIPFWESLLAGQSGIRPISEIDLGTLPIPYGGELRDFEAKKYVKPRKAIKMMCREVQVGQAAAAQAVEDAGIDVAEVAPDRFGIVFGSEMLYGHPSGLKEVFASSMDGGEISFEKWGERFTHDMFPLWLLLYLPNMVACHAAIALDARGPNNTIVQGPVSGLLSVMEAASYIERGWVDCMVAGGCGNTISPTLQVYLTQENLSKHPQAEAACRPFDALRDGGVVGEGAAAFMLESREHATRRGASVIASVAGIARTVGLADARFRGATTEAIRRSIRQALEGRPWLPRPEGQLQHVSANGLATIEDDRREAQAIYSELSDVPVTATKSYFGHLGAGASAMEMAAAVLALQARTVPHTLNYEKADPACPVSVVRAEPMHHDGDLAVVLSQSTTGQAAAITLRAER